MYKLAKARLMILKSIFDVLKYQLKFVLLKKVPYKSISRTQFE